MLRYFTAGESHGPCLTTIVEGVPAGFAVDIDKVNHDLWRRQQGYGRGGRMLIEKDEAGKIQKKPMLPVAFVPLTRGR